MYNPQMRYEIVCDTQLFGRIFLDKQCDRHHHDGGWVALSIVGSLFTRNLGGYRTLAKAGLVVRVVQGEEVLVDQSIPLVPSRVLNHRACKSQDQRNDHTALNNH